MEKLDFLNNKYTEIDLLDRLDFYISKSKKVMKCDNITEQRRLLTELRNELKEEAKHCSLLAVKKKNPKSKVFSLYSEYVNKAYREVTDQVKNNLLGVSAAGIKSNLLTGKQRIKSTIKDNAPS